MEKYYVLAVIIYMVYQWYMQSKKRKLREARQVQEEEQEAKNYDGSHKGEEQEVIEQPEPEVYQEPGTLENIFAELDRLNQPATAEQPLPSPAPEPEPAHEQDDGHLFHDEDGKPARLFDEDEGEKLFDDEPEPELAEVKVAKKAPVKEVQEEVVQEEEEHWVIETVTGADEERELDDFDLRKAIIYDAVLNRPYK